MKIRLRTREPRDADNVTEATSKAFADLIRAAENADTRERITGRFKLYRNNRGSVYLELESFE